MNILTINEIKAQYPNEWVLVGNPDLGGKGSIGTIIQKIESGIVLYHSKDKREVAYNNGKVAREGYDSVTLIYTGEVPKKRRFWL